MLTQEQVETEIRRLETAANHYTPPVHWDEVVTIRRILRWVLGIDPQSPLDYIMDPAPRELPQRFDTRDSGVTKKDGTT